MSQFFDKSSMVFLPSGYKDGKLYSQKPLSTDGELTFSRGSDIEATRVASNGYIEKAKVNLLLQSNSFDTTWTNVDTTETGGQTGYDGSNDAWLLTATSTSSTYIDQSLSTNSVVTLSVYAKANTADFIELVTIGGGLNPRAWFDLSTGSVGTSYNVIDTNIEAISSGWYRCSITLSGSITNYRFYATSADNSTSIGIGDSIYIQDAQLNYGLVAQEYQETTTTTAVTGITNDMPRLDYSGGASCPSLKLEPSRSNKNSFDSYFGSWYTLDAITATHNATTSPEGVTNGTFLQRTSSTGNARLQTPIMTVSSGAKVVHSIFLKAGTANNVILYSTQGGEGKKFDLTTGTAGDNFISAPDDYGIESYGSDWYRIWIVSTMPATSAQCWVYIDAAATTGFYAYGFQTEEGSYPTSLIPCNGTSATRTADAASKTGITSLIGQTEGTIYTEVNFSKLTGTVPREWFIISDANTSATSDWVTVSTSGAGTNLLRARIAQSGTIKYDKQYTIPAAGVYKMAFAYKSGDCELYVNGSAVGTVATNSAFTLSMDRIITSFTSGTFELGDGLNQALVFKTRLSNSDLAALTSL